MAKKLAVVLTSGGLDSTVAAALTGQDSRVALLHLQYGQQAAAAEAKAFGAVCDWLRPAYREIVSLGEWGRVADSTLLNPHGDIEDARAVGARLAGTFTPMLAAAMICRAAAWAYTLGADRVVWGISLDNPGNYPDRADAVRLLCWQLVQRSLPEGHSAIVEAPLAQYAKEAVAALARDLNVPVEATWSCLRGGAQPCGRCFGCEARAKALG